MNQAKEDSLCLDERFITKVTGIKKGAFIKIAF
jgi:hypothetical protein